MAFSIKDISVNIRRLLKIKNYSIIGFSKECGIGSATLSNILNCKSHPNSTTLIRIANTLNVYFNDLLADATNLKTLRFRIDKSLSAREIAIKDQIMINASTWLKDYVHLEKLTGLKNEYKLDTIKITNPIEAAHKVRELLNISPNEVITDIVSLMEKKGIKVGLCPFNFQRTFSLSINEIDGGPAIIINTDDNITTERKIFSIARELGHLILHPHSFNGNVEIENKTEENEADIFACEFLVPDSSFNEKLKEYKGFSWYKAVIEIKKYFFVSYKTILYKIKNSPLLSSLNNEDVYQKFNEVFNIQDTDESPLPALKEIEGISNVSFIDKRYPYLVREAYEKELITISRASELLNINMEQMRMLLNYWL